MTSDFNQSAVERLIVKAASATNSKDALRFSQAAYNIANAVYASRVTKKEVD